MRDASERKIKAECLLWTGDEYYAHAPLLHVTHEQKRNKEGVNREKDVGWGEKGAVGITQTDKSGGGVSQGIRREDGKMREGI